MPNEAHPTLGAAKTIMAMMSAKVRKAVFPAAGLGTRFLPATKASRCVLFMLRMSLLPFTHLPADLAASDRLPRREPPSLLLALRLESARLRFLKLQPPEEPGLDGVGRALGVEGVVGVIGAGLVEGETGVFGVIGVGLFEGEIGVVGALPPAALAK